MILYAFLAVIFCVFLALYYKFKSYVPILMYHRIAAVPGDRNALPPEKFREQLSYLAGRGFTTITAAMLADFLIHRQPLPPRPVLLTFDDGYEDNYTAALPLLQEYGMTAVVCPISDWIGKENKWENFNKAPARTMDDAQLRAWLAAGMEIAAHTKNHPFLTQCGPKRLADEVSGCKSALQSALGRPIQFLCYPYGWFNDDVIAAAKAAGYRGGFAIFENVPLWRLDPFALPRIQIPARQPLWEFKLKVGSIHMLFVAMRQWERRLKQRLR